MLPWKLVLVIIALGCVSTGQTSPNDRESWPVPWGAAVFHEGEDDNGFRFANALKQAIRQNSRYALANSETVEVVFYLVSEKIPEDRQDRSAVSVSVEIRSSDAKLLKTYRLIYFVKHDDAAANARQLMKAIDDANLEFLRRAKEYCRSNPGVCRK